jgi:hypothetical protein
VLVGTLGVILVLSGCQVRFGGGKATGRGAAGGFGTPGQTPVGAPGEQEAIDTVYALNGWATLEGKTPGNPVIAVGVFKPEFKDADLKKLASLTHVRKMDLACTGITGAGFRDLAGLTELTELSVAQTPVNDAGLTEIARFRGLKTLDIRATKITDAGLRRLAPLDQLEELNVANMGMGSTAAVHIAHTFPRLRKLYIDNSSIGDLGVIELARMPALQTLTLNGTRVTDKGLAAVPHLKTLEELQLSFDITDHSAKILSRCKGLRVLRLFHTKVTDRGLQDLGTLPALRELELRGNTGITNQALSAFINAHPDCTVKQ